MSAEDWIPELFDSYDEYEGLDAQCKYCGEDGLVWEETTAGWRLFDPETGERHDCRREPADACDFEDVSDA